jgi:flagellar hook-length control protein FliK
MAVVSNPLLQIGTPVGGSGKAPATAVGALSKVADATKDGRSSFAEVYAKEHPALGQKHVASATARTAGHLATADKKPAFATQEKDNKPAGAADGKLSPADKADQVDKADRPDKTAKADNAGADDDRVDVKDDDGRDESQAVSAKEQDALEAAADDSASPALAATVPVVDPLATALPAALAPGALDPTQAAQGLVDPAQLQSAAQVAATAADDGFDPAADPLADLPMLRMALEQTAKEQGTTSVHAQADTASAQAAGDPATEASFADSMGAMLEQQKLTESAVGTGDDDALGAIGELKGDLATDGSARVDDLSSRLSQLNQAVGGKAASAATPLAQPLNMQQNGWSEGLVNRVMYLSSQNLKSADIQLHPLELGRLDIRVDVTADQQTQITFHSAHLGVREALDSQQGRLRDMLAQQGMTQVDVNVSDQSRQSQQQQQQAQASQNSGGSHGRGGNLGDEGEDVSAVAAAAATQTVIGSSVVDYYA